MTRAARTLAREQERVPMDPTLWITYQTPSPEQCEAARAYLQEHPWLTSFTANGIDWHKQIAGGR